MSYKKYRQALLTRNIDKSVEGGGRRALFVLKSFWVILAVALTFGFVNLVGI